jgi:glycosyltransferase 2 family protein
VFFFIKLFILGLFIYLINKRINFDFDIIQSIELNYVDLFIGFFFTTFAMILSSQRWRAILKLISIKLTIKESILYTYIGAYFNVFFPGDMGGDLVKTYYVNRDKKKSIVSVGATIIIDRFIGLLTLLALPSCIFLFYNININLTIFNRSISIDYLLYIGFFISIVMFLLLINSKNIIQHIYRLFLSDSFFGKIINKVFNALNDLSSDYSKYMKSIIWSFVSQIMLYFGGYFIALSVVDSVDFLYWVILYPVIVALSSLPITFSGFGLREYLFIIFSDSLNLQEGELILVVSILIFLSLLSQSILGAIVYFFVNGSKENVLAKNNNVKGGNL